MKKYCLLLSVLMSLFFYSARAQDPLETQADAAEAQQNGDEDARGAEADDRAAIDGAIENLNTYRDWLAERKNEWNEVQNFSVSECSPDFGASGASMMPSTCAGNSGCSECYDRAVGELNFIRRQLGRLSCIYSNTKQFNKSALAFGDNMSGIHAVTGMAWQSVRGEVVAAYTSFGHTYDSKYTDMMGSLQRALQSISLCEQQYGLPDWYQRFGFIYFEFMQDKYKRLE